MADTISRVNAESTRILEKMWRRRDRRGQGIWDALRAALSQVYDPETGGVPPGALPPLAGDVTGPPGANTVVKIQNQAVSTTDPTTGQALVWDGTSYVPTTPAAAGHTIEDEGTPLTQRTTINFTGAGVTATDSGGETVVTIPGGVGSDELAKVSANDTTAGYLNGKLVAGTGITLTENNDGGNETLTIAAQAAGGRYRAWTYTTFASGEFTYVVDGSGNPVYSLQELE